MNKLKIILIISVTFLSAGFLFAQSANAVPAISFVQFETQPLFNNVNFGPGDSVTKWVKVDNTSGSTQKIIAEAINENDSDNFSGKLNLIIKEEGTIIFNNTLKTFFDQGETYLSDLVNNSNTQYDFTITFNADTNDDWQGKTLGFDIVVGFQGQEGQSSGGGGTGGSSGGGVAGAPALTVYNEAASIATTDESVTITWTTSYAATSYVIYGTVNESRMLDLNDSSGNPPKFGYAHATVEYNTPANINGVTNHSVTITGLTSGTTYYYRAVSHGSLAIGQELTFTTLETQPINLESGTETGTTETENDNTTSIGEVAGAFTQRNLPETNINGEELALTEQEQEIEEFNQKQINTTPQQETAESLLLATVFDFSTLGNSIRTIIVIVLIVIVIYFIIMFWRKKKKKDAILQDSDPRDGYQK
jgi:hypothetical protein